MRVVTGRAIRLLVMACALLATVAGVAIGAVRVTSHASAETINACANKTNGLLRLVDTAGACRVDETAVSWPSAAGAGGGLAYARILSDGTLDTSKSKNVTSTSLVTGPDFWGMSLKTICIQLDPSVAADVKNMVVQPNVLSPYSPSAASASLATDASSQMLDLMGCPQGTDAMIVTGSVEYGSSGNPYYVLFN